MRRVNLFIGSVAWTGLFPIAPATFTCAWLALVLWLWAPGPWTLLLMLPPALALSVPVASRMERDWGHDPGRCTIDELVGLLITFQGTILGGPGAWQLALAGFLLFRFFDIAKIWPASRLESLPAGWGIVADDVMAGIYSLIALRILDRWLPLG